jgi:hypothetical protein
MPVVSDCLGEVRVNTSTVNCDNWELVHGDRFCAVTFLGELDLDSVSRGYIPSFCLKDSTILKFQNDRGELEEWVLDGKGYTEREVLQGKRGLCPNNSRKMAGYCFRTEQASVSLQKKDGVDNIIMFLEIEVDTTDPSNPNPGQGTSLNIWRLDNPYANSKFKVIINQGSLTYSSLQGQVVHSSLIANGKEFRNVFTMEAPDYHDPYTYYYTRTEGLIAYMDESGVVWHRTE